MHQLQGLDMSFVALETPRSPMHIGSILIYDPSTAPGGIVRFQDILAFIRSRLLLATTVRRRLVKVPLNLDYPYWVEDEAFDLENHVRQLTLPEPRDWRQLHHEAARIFARPLDLTRPPWELTVVEGLDAVRNIPAGSYAVIAKVHHAAIDGIAGIDLLKALHTLSPETASPLEPDPWRPEPVPSPLELLARSWLNSVRNPMRTLQLAAQVAPALGRVVMGAVNDDFSVDLATATPKTRFNAAISADRVVGARRLTLGDVRAIRALAPDCKLNDVFLAIVGGALHRYLRSKRELPEQTLTAMVPISVRSKREAGPTGNQIAAMIVPLGSEIADPAERLRHIRERTRNSKALTDAIGVRAMIEMSNDSPALLLALGAQYVARRGRDQSTAPIFNTMVTNVPGPKVPLYSAGARLHSMTGLMCLTDGVGLAHVVQSYLDEATIGFIADGEMMPDPEFYADCLGESFDELVVAAQQYRTLKKQKSGREPGRWRATKGNRPQRKLGRRAG